MYEVTYRHQDGTMDVVMADAGTNVMRVALANGVKGIVGECGGELMCATCHVYVTKRAELTGEASESEEEMLEFASCPRRANSRLSCQITVGPETDGLEVETPERQN